MSVSLASPLAVAQVVTRRVLSPDLIIEHCGPSIRFDGNILWNERMYNPPNEFGIDFEFEMFARAGVLRLIASMKGRQIIPWDGMQDFFSDLDAALGPFFEGYYPLRGVLEVYGDLYGVVLGYEEDIEYEPLDDDELQESIGCALLAGTRTLCLVEPVVEQVVTTRTAPDPFTTIKLLERAFGAWEVSGRSDDIPKGETRLPLRLYGGIRTLGAQ